MSEEVVLHQDQYADLMFQDSLNTDLLLAIFSTLSTKHQTAILEAIQHNRDKIAAHDHDLYRESGTKVYDDRLESLRLMLQQTEEELI